MNRQTALQAKETVPLRKNKSSWLNHAAVRPVAEAEQLQGSTAGGLAVDLTTVPAQPQTQAVEQSITRFCPMSPQRCPFGGACHSCPPRVQTKLKIGQPGDKYEQEADRVAEQVMRMPQAQWKACSSCKGKEEDEDKILQTKSAGSAGNIGSQVDHPLIQNVLSSPGQPLDAATRSFMEPRFGQDFSGVRVHTDGQAAESAREVNARAYTVGRDVVFGVGQYTPGTDEGKRLMAHELAHVGQQGKDIRFKGIIQRRVVCDEFGGACQSVPDEETYKSVADERKTEQISNDFLSPNRKKIERYGIAYKKEGVNLRDQPGPNSTVLVRLPFNTRMYIDSEKNGHYFIGTDSGKFGYVATNHVKDNLPEPDAKIYYIESGDTALEISRKHYGGEAEWGSDHRFFVNGLVHVNSEKKEPGIYKPDPNVDWDTTQVRSGYMIWVPSIQFMRSLQGVVRSGSLTYEVWQNVKDAAAAVGEFLLGAGAFVVGLLHGALESVWDILVGLKDLAVMAGDLIKWLVGRISGDNSEGLFDSLKGINWSELVQGWIDDFEDQWDNKSLLKKWHFRGWVMGYAIAEVVMLFFSGGIIQGIKWVGKSAKVAKIISQLPKIARLEKIAKTSKIGQRFSKGLQGTTAAVRAAREWAKAAFRLSNSFVQDLSLESVKRLKQIPNWAHERIRNMTVAAKRTLFGCNSPCIVDFDKIMTALKIPQGFSVRQWKKFRQAARRLTREAKLPKGELAIQGSRTTGVAKVTSDIDIILRVEEKIFFDFAHARISKVRKGTKLHKTLLNAAKKGKLSRFDISPEFNKLLREHLLPHSKFDIDFSIIKKGSKYDTGPFIQIGR